MLFYITKEILAEAEINNPRVIEVLDFVALSHYYGRHIVFGPREVLEQLSNISFFNDKRTTSVFKSILNRYSTFGSIKKIVTQRVELVLDTYFHVSLAEDGRYSVIYCPIISKSLENLMNGTELLGENVEEIDMYEFMAKYYLKKNNIQLNLHHKKLHGGGDTLRSVWETEARQENFCLAFLDSDKKWHGGSFGETLKKVINIQNKEKYYTANFIFSDKYREIENMIPLEILKSVSTNDYNWYQGFHDVEIIINAGKDVQYYDIKNGLSLKKYIKLKSQQNEKMYIDEQLICLYPEYDNSDIWIKELPETTILLHGMGENVLKRSTTYLQHHVDNWFEKISLDTLLEKEWLRIGKEIINWTCASNPIRL